MTGNASAGGETATESDVDAKVDNADEADAEGAGCKIAGAEGVGAEVAAERRDSRDRGAWYVGTETLGVEFEVPRIWIGKPASVSNEAETLSEIDVEGGGAEVATTERRSRGRSAIRELPV